MAGDARLALVDYIARAMFNVSLALERLAEAVPEEERCTLEECALAVRRQREEVLRYGPVPAGLAWRDDSEAG